MPANPSIEQFQTTLKRIKPTCAGITASYVCGNHDAVPQYSGEVISVTSGDEIAMNSMLISVVEIDGAGNGTGIIKVGMLNNAKLGVALSGIVVAKGGCIIAGKAELNSVAISVLNDKQREQLAKAYAVFEKATDAAIENAGAVAEVYNDIAAALNALREKAKIIIDKINSGQKPSQTDLKTLETLAKASIETKKKELENLRKLPSADTSKYINLLASWVNRQEIAIICVSGLKNTTTESPKKGPAEFYIFDCDLGNFSEKEPQQDKIKEFPIITLVLPIDKFVPFDGDNKACKKYCDQMLASVNVTCGGSNSKFQIWEHNDPKDAYKGKVGNNVQEAIKYIISELQNNRPVIVGIDYGSISPMNEGTTDHFLVLVGCGFDIITYKGKEYKQNYFRFFDPATSSTSKGTSPENKLIYYPSQDMIYGTSVMTSVYRYTIAQVRKNN